VFRVYIKILFLFIISLPEITFFFEFHSLFFLVKDPITGIVLLKGARENGVYTLPNSLVSSPKMSLDFNSVALRKIFFRFNRKFKYNSTVGYPVIKF